MVETGRDALEWSISEDVPEGRCGFTLDCAGASPVDADEFEDAEHWDRDGETVSCRRESWTDHDQCIWHAVVADKPPDELADARTDT